MGDLIVSAACDFHVHLRNDGRTPHAVRAIREGGTARVLVMPNTSPSIATGSQAVDYKRELKKHDSGIDYIMALKLSPETTTESMESALESGVFIGKQYPDGVTTNSQNGVRDVRSMFPVYEFMQANDMVLSLHGEVPGVFVMDAEEAFLEDLDLIHANFPKLRMVLEHISTRASVEKVKSMPECVAATITDHHLLITLQDVVGSRIRPHHFCMPVAKRPEDRQALVQIVKAGHGRFFSGSDSAPHFQTEKENACGCAGVFTSPIHMQLLADLFEKENMLDRLENFTSLFGNDFYRFKPLSQEITLVRKSMKVPEQYGGIVPFFSGRDLSYSLES